MRPIVAGGVIAAAQAIDEPVLDEPGFTEPTFEEPFGEVPAPTVDGPAHETAEVAPAPGEPSATSAAVASGAPPEAHLGRVDQSSPGVLSAGDPLATESDRAAPPATARRRRRPAKPAPTFEPAVVAADHGPAEGITTPVSFDPDTEPRVGRSRSLVRLVSALGALVALAIVGLIFAVHHQHTSNNAVKERAASTAAAVKVVSDTTTLDYRKMDDWLRRVQADSTDGSTPGKGLRTDFANKLDPLSSVTATNKSVSVGRVVRSVYCGGVCATSQVAGNTASALVYGTAAVTSTATPAGVTTKSRFTVKLIKVNGKWLAINVDNVGVAPTS